MLSIDLPAFPDLVSDYYDDIRQRLIFYYDYLDRRFAEAISKDDINLVEECELARQLSYIRGVIMDVERLSPAIPNEAFEDVTGRDHP